MFTLAISALIAGTMIIGCTSSADKVENAQDNVQAANEQLVKANQALDQAIRDSIQQFRKESEERIIANENTIVEYRARIARENKENRAIYEKKLAELEQQNREMKRNLADFREDSRENWESFRIKFNNDMERSGRAFRDFWGIKR